MTIVFRLCGTMLSDLDFEPSFVVHFFTSISIEVGGRGCPHFCPYHVFPGRVGKLDCISPLGSTVSCLFQKQQCSVNFLCGDRCFCEWARHSSSYNRKMSSFA